MACQSLIKINILKQTRSRMFKGYRRRHATERSWVRILGQDTRLNVSVTIAKKTKEIKISKWATPK